MAKKSEPFYNADYYSDDFVEFNQEPEKKKSPAIFGAVLLLVGSGFFLQTTLASNMGRARTDDYRSFRLVVGFKEIYVQNQSH